MLPGREGGERPSQGSSWSEKMIAHTQKRDQVTLEKGVCYGLGLLEGGLCAGRWEMCGPKGRLGPDLSGCPHSPGKPSAPLL